MITNRATTWGFNLGILVSFPYFALLWAFGPFGCVFNIIIGTVLGAINGKILSNKFDTLIVKQRYRLHFFAFAFSITFVVSLISYSTLFVATIWYMQNILFFPALLSLGNALIAGYISQRAARLYKKQRKQKNNDD